MVKPERSTSFDIQVDIPLFGRTHVENEETVVALYTLRRCLTRHSRVQAWQASQIAFIAEELEATSKINCDRLFDEAKEICRQLGLPSVLIAEQLYTATWQRGFSQAYGIRFEEVGWAAPENEDEVRQVTEGVLVEALRFAIGEIERGGCSEIPWPDYRHAIMAYLVLLGRKAIETGRDLQHAPPGRRHHAGEAKAVALFLTIVGDDQGKRNVKSLAYDEGAREHFGLSSLNEENARRTLYEWIVQLKHLLLLEPPSI